MTVKYNNKVLSTSDYTAAYANGRINAGKYNVTVTLKGNYRSTAAASFKINAASLASAKVTAKNQTYTGKALKPAPTVTLKGVKMKKGTDYTVAMI